MFIIELIQSMHLMTYLPLLLVEKFQPKLEDVNSLIKPSLTTTALMFLMTNRMRNMTVFVNVLPQPHIQINGGLQYRFFSV